MEFECLEDWVGLSETDCTCFDEPPENYNSSRSGLFITQLNSLSRINALVSCENGGEMWTLLSNARRDAINDVLNEIANKSSANFSPKRTPFNGSIGEGAYKGELVTNKAYAGIRIQSPKIKGGILKIKKIGVLHKTTGTFFLHLYNSNNELLDSYQLNSIAYQHKINTVDIELDLNYKYNARNEYFFVFDTSGVQPLTNKLKCNCDSYKFVFDERKPYYESMNREAYAWSNWFMISGYQTNSLISFDEPDGTNQASFPGLTFDVQVGCSMGSVLCNEDIDLEVNPVGKAIAYCIQYKAAIKLVSGLLNADIINRLTLVNPDALTAEIEDWSAKYTENMNWIAQNLNYLSNECFDCVKKQRPKIIGMFS